MPPTPSQIRELLLKSTDNEANVVDMGNVVKAIAYLENTQITKEALEATRLGKTVNDIRKKTKSKDLATRCKALVRQWNKQFVRGTQKKDTPDTANDGAASHSKSSVTPTDRPPSRGRAAASSVDKTRTENRKRPKPGSPDSASNSPTAELHPAKRSSGRVSSLSAAAGDSTDSNVNGIPGQVIASPKTSKTALNKMTPKTQSPRVLRGKKVTKTRKAALSADAGTSSGKVLSPAVGEATVPQTKSSRSSSPAVCNETTRSPNVTMPKLDNEILLSKASLMPSPKTSPISSIVSSTSPNVAGKHSAPINPLEARIASESEKSISPALNDAVTKSRKMNSSKTNSTESGSKLSPKVQPNSKPIEDGNSSVAMVKLREDPPRLSPHIPMPSVTKQLASVKTNVDGLNLAPVLKTKQVNAPTSRTENTKVLRTMTSIFDDDDSDDDGGLNEVEPSIDTINSFSLASPTASPTASPAPSEGNDDSKCHIGNNGSQSHLPDVLGITTESSIPEPAKTVVEETLESDNEDEVIVKARPATQEEVDRLHADRWEGVNGCYNEKGEWFNWTQCLSVCLNQQDDTPLHILPYVDLG